MDRASKPYESTPQNETLIGKLFIHPVWMIKEHDCLDLHCWDWFLGLWNSWVSCVLFSWKSTMGNLKLGVKYIFFNCLFKLKFSYQIVCHSTMHACPRMQIMTSMKSTHCHILCPSFHANCFISCPCLFGAYVQLYTWLQWSFQSAQTWIFFGCFQMHSTNLSSDGPNHFT